MKKNELFRDSSQISLINIAAVSILALIFAAASIVNVWILNNNVNLIYKVPYSVTKYINDITNILSSMEMRIVLLPAYASAGESEVIRQDIEALTPRLMDGIQYIKENSIRPKSKIGELERTVNSILEKQELIFDKIDTYTPQGLESDINSNLVPYYRTSAELCDLMADLAQETADEISQKSTWTAATNTAMAAVLAAVLVIVTVYLQTVVRKKNGELLYREHLLSMITENVDDVTLIYNPAKKEINFVSANAQRVLEHSPEELKERCFEIFPELWKRLSFLNGIKNPDETEFRFIRKNDTIPRWLQPRFYPIQADKKENNVIITLTDLTEEKKARYALENALLTAQKATDARRAFLSRMSHEIRTPLNAIIGMAAIAQSAEGNPVKTQDCLMKIRFSSKHLLNIINEVLDMSAIENGKMQVSNEPFQLKGLLASVTSVYYDQCKQAGKNFKCYAYNIHNSALIGDQFRLNQILLNLLSNAFKFTEPGGTVTLSVEELALRDRRVFLRFCVTDDGIGMDEAAVKRVFEPFEQASPTTAQKYGGSGLGLSITKNLAELMGGSINVTSKKGEGTQFRVELSFECEPQECISDASSFSSLNVLLIDTDDQSRPQVSSALHSLNVQTKEARSFKQANALLYGAGKKGIRFDYCILVCETVDKEVLDFAARLIKSPAGARAGIALFAYSFVQGKEDLKKRGIDYLSLRPVLRCELARFFINKGLAQDMQKDEQREKEYDFSGRRLLLAEDNELNLEIARELLKRTGAEVDAAHDGQEACDMFLNTPQGSYDAVLLDIQMPLMDGYQAAKKIRASSHPDAKAVPIIAMTANAFSEDVVAALSAGMDGHVAKPVEPELLYQTLGAFLKGAPKHNI